RPRSVFRHAHVAPENELDFISSLQRRNKVKFVFWRDMCVPENTSRPVNVRLGTRRALQQAAIPIVGKGLPFSTG
ncbi:MAG: hypothetical protein IJO69_01945, partial [Ruminiclostridium sp.]|nr:hypothetical protein [Ruminiclostridium sp.]